MTIHSDLNAIRRRPLDLERGPSYASNGARKDEFSPASLVNDSALTQFKINRPIEKIIPSISASAMRLSLYRRLEESGAKRMDGTGVSVEWTAAILAYSAFNAFFPSGFDRGMKLFSGYPRFLHYDAEKGKDTLFRIYARTVATAEDIVRSASLMASHRGYITGRGSGLSHYEDLTGIFITRPGVAPKRVGISGYEHWVDFRLAPAVPLLKFTSELAWLIAGPARLSREEAERAARVISGEEAPDARLADAVELVRMYPEGAPPFRIPINVTGAGRLDGLSFAHSGAAASLNAGGLSAHPALASMPVSAGAVRFPMPAIFR